MPKRAADDGEVTEASKKKVKQDSGAPDSHADGELHKDDEGNYYLDLGSLKRATVSVFKGKAQVNIREYYTDKTSGDIKPGKKGITLNATQWSSLVAAVPALSKQLESVETGETAATAKPTKPKKSAGDKAAKEKKSEKPAKKKKKKKEETDEEDEED